MLLVNKALRRVAGSSTTFMNLLAKLAQNVLITARKRSLGQGNIFTPVCHSVHRGVCLSACWDTTPPPPPQDEAHPQDQAQPTGTRHPLGPDTHPQGQDTHPPPPSPWDQTPPPGPGTPPPGPGTPPPRDQADTVNARAVRILLECNLVFVVILSETVLAPSPPTGCESKKHQAHQLWHTRLKSISPLKCTEE